MLKRSVAKSLWLGLWLLSSVVVAQFPTVSGQWPQFRGPLRDAVSSDTGLLTQWPDDGPPLVWQTRGAGRGYGTVSIVGDRLYTLGDGLSIVQDADEYVVCFSKSDGAVIWKTRLGPAWTSGRPDWQSSRSTPTVDGDLLYVLTPHGDLVCLETATGTERWRKIMAKDFGGLKGDSWGYSESVLIDGQRVVCTPGGRTATMVALDKATGDEIWRSVWENDRGAGHASIVISEVAGTRVYVNTTAGGALGVRAEDGHLLWTYEIDRTTAVIPTPIIRDDLVFFTAGYRRGGALLRQIPGDNGTVSIETVYPLNTDLANKHGGVVLVGDYLYGDTDDQGIPYCAEFMTGRIAWKERGPGRGSAAVAAADGHLYIRWQNGIIALVKATPEGFQPQGSFQIPGSGDRPSWSHPVIVGGRLYLREGDAILCYDVTKTD
jgi:outer membrane protein assembly factor BamB